jgi:hypothetical protein
MVNSLYFFYFLNQGKELVTVIVIDRQKIDIKRVRFLSIYISLNRWTIKEKGKRQKRRLITEENSGKYIEYDTSSQGNDFSLGGDDEIDVDSCGK